MCRGFSLLNGIFPDFAEDGWNQTKWTQCGPPTVIPPISVEGTMPPCPGFRDNSQHVRQQDLLHCIRHSANTTLQDFEAKCKALLTSMLALPVAQNKTTSNSTWYLTQNDAVKNTLTADKSTTLEESNQMSRDTDESISN
ncbi:hypothetical protein FB45DRAFT_1010736 [Roridomyces roridus]|uniref:Uncharacterized protein n=1 Tax=Roridomyces roridus TaxID=1738132 RepID=A0AAD7B3V1_9AGAR|nr:hypothetical protein FB45DRAFT_1010736 [Roridomyces roridus]